MTIIEAFRQDAWTRQDPRRPNNYARRQALVEVDALAAKVPGLALDEPQTICRLQFPVMRQYEAETHCDITGGTVFTPSKGLLGVGLPCKAVECDTCYTLMTPEGTKKGIAIGWEDVRNLQELTVASHAVRDYTDSTNSPSRALRYAPPFDNHAANTIIALHGAKTTPKSHEA